MPVPCGCGSVPTWRRPRQCLTAAIAAALWLTAGIATGWSASAAERADRPVATVARAAQTSGALLRPGIHLTSAVVGGSVAAALRRTALPAGIADEVKRAFGCDQGLAPAAGTWLTFVYEEERAGVPAGPATLRYVALDDGEATRRIHRYRTANGNVAYLREDGVGVLFLAFGEPLEDAEVTSRFGWRVHPVFGDRRFHKGVDLGAPQGTPVHAVAGGRVAEIGWKGNYGRYIRIEHEPGVATSYAHLSRFAPGLAAGARVRKGQVIGRVGRTGVATGPHLDYEVIVGEENVDPLAPPSCVPIRLEGASLERFQAQVPTVLQVPAQARAQ